MEISERLFQGQVIELAQRYGWAVHHVPPMRYSGRNTLANNWGTGGLAGMPDLTLISLRGKGIIYAELKTDSGKLSDAQVRVIELLRRNGAQCYIWRPKDLESLAKTLSGL
jgi:hypothetical protein